MNPATILAVAAKGLSIVEAVWDNRELALSAFNSVKHIIDGHKTMTPEELAAVETNLDAMLDEFNEDLPPVGRV